MTSYISQWPKQHVISVKWSHILKYNAKYVKEKTVQQRISKSSNYTYTHLMASFPSTTWLSQYLKGKTSLDLNEARDDGVLGAVASAGPNGKCKHFAPRSVQIITSTPHQSIFWAGCSSWRPINSVKALTEKPYC